MWTYKLFEVNLTLLNRFVPVFGRKWRCFIFRWFSVPVFEDLLFL